MPVFDALKNFGYAQVLGAPNPGMSGNSMTLAAGQGANLPATPFNMVIYPAGAIPLIANAEIVRVTNVAGDVVTMTRQQEGTAARNILVGDQCVAAITAKTLTDMQDAINAASGAVPPGSGSPEGVVAAPAGSTYLDVAGAPLYGFWVKASGSGNTGWVQLQG